MYICICNAITDREIRGAADLGCRSLEELRRDLGVASCCGKCAHEAGALLNQCLRTCGHPCAAACAAGDD
jgi:bacterioferritin-associated ferredoxin